MNANFLIYGANGYTGALIAREAVARGLRPVLAGRNAAAVTALAQELQLESRVFLLDDPAALDAGLAGVGIVLHCAGPFAQTAQEMADACLRTGVHYLDITGEPEVYVQRMAPQGISCVLAIVDDPSFGSLLSFGLSGLATELLGDRAFRVVPVSDTDAAALVRAPRAAPLLAGYRGTPDMALAVERGEIDGVCGWDWSSFKSQKPDWLRDNKANVLLQVSMAPHPELTKMGEPTVFQFVDKDEDRKVVELVISQTVFHRSYIAPPETPPAQLEVLRAAFDKTMSDPQFLADAERMRVDIEPLSGAKVQEVVQGLYATPKAIVA